MRGEASYIDATHILSCATHSSHALAGPVLRQPRGFAWQELASEAHEHIGTGASGARLPSRRSLLAVILGQLRPACGGCTHTALSFCGRTIAHGASACPRRAPCRDARSMRV